MPRPQILSYEQAKRFYHWMGAKSDTQRFYEQPALADLVAHTPTMQTANKYDQNNILAASQETGTNYRSRTIVYHRDGTVTLWDVFSRAWVRTDNPSDQLLGTLPRAEIDRIRQYLQNRVSALTMR